MPILCLQPLSGLVHAIIYLPTDSIITPKTSHARAGLVEAVFLALTHTKKPPLLLCLLNSASDYAFYIPATCHFLLICHHLIPQFAAAFMAIFGRLVSVILRGVFGTSPGVQKNGHVIGFEEDKGGDHLYNHNIPKR